jgi:glycosyltransferase involved in cell wall biosynthesis
MQFMRRFARRTRVVYVNSLGVKAPSVSEGRMFFRRVKRKLGSVLRFYRDGGEGFGVLSPVFAPFASGPAATAARSALSLQLRGVMKVLGMRHPLIWVACPTAAVVLKRLNHRGIVHQLSDCYGALKDGEACAGAQAEREVAEQSDLIICSSERLLERARRLYGKGEYVDHGVDFTMFEAAGRSVKRPIELEGVKPPLIGFYGNIDGNTVDRQLLELVCRLRPQYTFVLVGDMSSEFEGLKAIPNVVAISRQPYQRVAQFGAVFDVCLMPWLNNEWIEHCNPVKLKEYLALGKPVVSSPFPELQRSGSLCFQASGPEAFAAAIDRALRDDHPTEQEKRKAWASQHTWDEKFESVLNLLRNRGIEANA